MNSNFFTGNRRDLRQVTESSLVIVTANDLLQKSADTVNGFKQDSNFFYLTGVTDPGVILVIDGTEEYLILPKIGRVQLVMDPQIDIKKMQAISGVKDILENKQGWDKLKKAIIASQSVAIMEPSSVFMKDYGFYVNPARRTLKNKIKKHYKQTKFEDIRSYMARLRVIKQAVEIEQIQKAVDISIDAYLEAYKKIKKMEFEYQFEAELTRGIRSRGAVGHAFSPIVASGKNATLIHYVENSSRIDPKSLLLADFGAEWNNYAADIARTCSVGLTAKRQEDVLNTVIGVQQFALDCIRPGVLFMDYESAVEKKMGQVLKSLGLIKDQTNRSDIRQFFPHATSHFLGLDTHDVGDRRSAFEPGMILAVEPSIIIKNEKIGVRVEDDVLITKAGIKNLSARLPSVVQ